jgi:hypothetical protein
VTRIRLRAAYNPATLAAIYDTTYCHAAWPDHVIRVAETITAGRELIRATGAPATIADLSCGDGAIARALGAEVAQSGAVRVLLGDLTPGWEFCGPIEETLGQLTHVDLFICTETIEHLDDPDSVLAEIRRRSGSLLVSTPVGEETSANPEHYWGWDTTDVRDMLITAGWTPVTEMVMSWRDENNHDWLYQIWGCR